MSIWTDELTQAVLSAWKAGDSQGEIARRHGLTPSQVAGKINRLGARGIDRSPKAHPPRGRNGGQKDAGWEARLREPYAVFKARKQMERENGVR